jgi:hypothetical protein
MFAKIECRGKILLLFVKIYYDEELIITRGLKWLPDKSLLKRSSPPTRNSHYLVLQLEYSTLWTP